MLLLLQETGYGIPLGIAAIISACIINCRLFRYPEYLQDYPTYPSGSTVASKL
jgi:hypothetical protein